MSPTASVLVPDFDFRRVRRCMFQVVLHFQADDEDQRRYIRFSFPKQRQVDQQFIELFRPDSVWDSLGRPSTASTPSSSSSARPSSKAPPSPAFPAATSTPNGSLSEVEEEEDRRRWVPAWELLPRGVRRCRMDDDDSGGEAGRGRMILGL